MTKAPEQPVSPDRWLLTKRQVADLCNVTSRTVNAWQQARGFPRPPGRGRLDLRDVVAWFASQRDEAAAGVISPAVAARMACDDERRRKWEQDRLITAGKLHDVSACQERHLRKIHAVKAELLSMPRTLSPQIASPAEVPRVEGVIRARVLDILRSFAQGAAETEPRPKPKARSAPKRKRAKRRKTKTKRRK